jgi:imidazolonepropionase-like amidohydrolase
MKKLIIIGLLFVHVIVLAQENQLPSVAQTKRVILSNATIHIGNGKVIEKGTLIFEEGKITDISNTNSTDPLAVDCKGGQIYPGFISPATNLGLVEVESVRATNDNAEVGNTNASVRAVSAFNTDSKVINTVRSNGVLLAHIVPEGNGIAGVSSVVQLDAWNFVDAAYKIDNGIVLAMPSFITRGGGGPDVTKRAQKRIEEIIQFFKEAKAYSVSTIKGGINLKYEGMADLFTKKKKLFVEANAVKQILAAINLKKEFDIDVVIIGGADSYLISDLLKQYSIPVILQQPHSLPTNQDDDVDQPYKTPAMLQKAGVLFCLSNEGFWQQRNLPFLAGTAATYGLSKEEALASITSNTAKILGIDGQTGTLEIGKDANIIVSQGDALDMRTSIITQAYINGRTIDLNNKQTMLTKKFKTKYNIK